MEIKTLHESNRKIIKLTKQIMEHIDEHPELENELVTLDKMLNENQLELRRKEGNFPFYN